MQIVGQVGRLNFSSLSLSLKHTHAHTFWQSPSRLLRLPWPRRSETSAAIGIGRYKSRLRFRLKIHFWVSGLNLSRRLQIDFLIEPILNWGSLARLLVEREIGP